MGLLLLPIAFGLLSATPSPALRPPAVPPERQSVEPAGNAMPPMESIALPQERPVLDAFLTDLRTASTAGSGGMLARFDDALAKLPAPTPFRGSIQMTRALLLDHDGRTTEAISAVDEAVRLLPSYSAPLLTAAHILAYSSHPESAADMLIRAAGADPVTTRDFDEYDVDAIMTRLEVLSDRLRLRRLADRLLAAGWRGGGAGSRSNLAVRAIEGAIDDGDVARARALVPELVVPSDSYRLLATNSARDIWPDIGNWAGEQLEKQWPLYLAEVEARWTAANDPARGRDYAGALRAADDPARLVEQFAGILTVAPRDAQESEFVFVVPQLAWARLRLGDKDAALRTFDQASTIWPLGSQGNALNVAANRGKFLVQVGQLADGLAQLDLAIADARKWGSQVNGNAVALMHLYRACALHELGRDVDAAPSLAIASSLRGASAARAFLCVGDLASARRAIVYGLADPAKRGSAIEFLHRKNLIPQRRSSSACESVTWHSEQIPWCLAPWHLGDASFLSP